MNIYSVFTPSAWIERDKMVIWIAEKQYRWGCVTLLVFEMLHYSVNMCINKMISYWQERTDITLKLSCHLLAVSVKCMPYVVGSYYWTYVVYWNRQGFVLGKDWLAGQFLIPVILLILLMSLELGCPMWELPKSYERFLCNLIQGMCFCQHSFCVLWLGVVVFFWLQTQLQFTRNSL